MSPTNACATHRRSAFVLFPCNQCNRRGAYLVPDHPVVRCKYCRWLRELTDGERATMSDLVLAIADARARDAARQANIAGRAQALALLAAGA